MANGSLFNRYTKNLLIGTKNKNNKISINSLNPK